MSARVVGMSAAVGLLGLIAWSLAAAAPPSKPLAPATFGEPFWAIFKDGNAELSSYRMTFTRYGQPRDGVAVTIVIPETFSDKLRVRADPGNHPKSDELPVLKMILVQDYPTGVYDYNQMTSSFVTMAERDGRTTGVPTKISFSAQEWCGHVYSQALFDRNKIRYVSHSYFDGEADEARELSTTAETISEDALFLWARGWGAPLLEPGEERSVLMVESLAYSRLNHEPLQSSTVKLSRSAEPVTIESDGKQLAVEYFKAEGRRRTWEFWVEREMPRRIVRWTSSSGDSGELIATVRWPYWRMNSNANVTELKELGLTRGGQIK